MSGLPVDTRALAASIELLVLDVDGILTDGSLLYTAEGEQMKAFNVKDGLGLRLLRDEGVKVAIISARRSPPLERRLRDLKIEHAYLGREDKMTALDEILSDLGIPLERVAYAGDDLIDLPVLRRVGLPLTVADAHSLVQTEVAWVTTRGGGKGAVREIADALLDARGRLHAARDALLGEEA